MIKVGLAETMCKCYIICIVRHSLYIPSNNHSTDFKVSGVIQ